MTVTASNHPPGIDPKRHRIARKNIGIAIFLGAFFGPLGYVYVRAWKQSAFNILTLNYLLFGIVLVPIHAAIIIRSARKQLRRVESRTAPSNSRTAEVNSSSD